MESPAVLIIIALSLALMFYLFDKKRGTHICAYCGYRGYQVIVTNGSFIIELFLWLCFIIPGLIYSFWRLASRERVCPSCNHKTMVLLSTPLGQKLQKEFYEDDKPELKIDSNKVIVLRKR